MDPLQREIMGPAAASSCLKTAAITGRTCLIVISTSTTSLSIRAILICCMPPALNPRLGSPTDRGEHWTSISGYNFKWGHRVMPDLEDPKMVYITTFGGGVWHGALHGDTRSPDIATPQPQGR